MCSSLHSVLLVTHLLALFLEQRSLAFICHSNGLVNYLFCLVFCLSVSYFIPTEAQVLAVFPNVWEHDGIGEVSWRSKVESSHEEFRIPLFKINI